MSETRRRFLPLIREEEWGARLAPADLAVNKVLAAAERRQARDAVDLAQIGEYFCPLGPLLMAAAAKPPNFSPGRMVEGIRRNALSFSAEEIGAVQGMPDDWSADFIRNRIVDLIDRAEDYIMRAPLELVGRLALSPLGVPVEVHDPGAPFELRAATDEPEVMPEFKNLANNWPRTR